MRRLLWVLPSLWLLSATPADACIHVGEGLTVSQKAQQIVVVHGDGREDLVIGVDYEAPDAPPTLGMVVPVPSVPDAYAALEPGTMDALREWVGLEMRSNARSRDLGPQVASAAAPESAVVELAPARVGPYEIQPLRATGAEAASALNEWLAEHALSVIPEAALAYYIERGWTFLAVQIRPEEGAEALAESASLPPLRISFASARAVVPLRLEAQGAPFEVSVHLITREPVTDEALEGARARGFVAAANEQQPAFPRTLSYPHTDRYRFTAAELPEPLKELVERFDDSPLYLRVLHARTFGIGAAEPMGWPEELSVPGVAEGERLEGGAPSEEPTATEEAREGASPDAEEGADGEGEDGEAEATDPAPAADVTPEPASDCGCRAAGQRAPLPWAPLLVVAALLWRRRR